MPYTNNKNQPKVRPDFTLHFCISAMCVIFHRQKQIHGLFLQIYLYASIKKNCKKQLKSRKNRTFSQIRFTVSYANFIYIYHR